MKKTRLVAGHRGIVNNIKWVTIVEVLEDIGRLQTGEFLITTGFELLENKERMKDFHHLLKSKLLSGVAIYTGFYMKEIPSSFIDLANKHDLPLIEIPTEINFSEITKAILEQIVNNQMSLLEQSENIHRELTNLILNDQSLTEVTKRLAQLTSAAIVVYNEFYDMIYANNDFYKNDDLKLNQTICNVNDKKLDITKHFLDSLDKEVTVKLMFEGQCFTIYPIIAKRSCYGWIVLIKSESNLQELDKIAIEQAAPIYAIEFLKKQAVEETQMRIQNNLLEDIFHKNYINEKVIIDQALKLNYDLSLNQSVFHLTFKLKDMDVELTERLYHIAEQILIHEKKQHIIQTKLNAIIFITNTAGETKEEKYKHCVALAKELLKSWTYYFPNIEFIIGIGKDYNRVDDLGKSAREAQYAVMLSDSISPNNHIVHYDDLGMYDLMLEMRRNGIDLTSIYEKYISAILTENDKDMNLIETLDSYFKNNQSIQKAAEELYIHRHTLRYRLNQIEIRTGLDIKSTEDLMKLHLGVIAYKLEKILEKDKQYK